MNIWNSYFIVNLLITNLILIVIIPYKQPSVRDTLRKYIVIWHHAKGCLELFNVILHLISTLRTIWIESKFAEKSLGVLMDNRLNMNQQCVLVQWHPNCIMKTVASRLRKVILRLSSSLECLFPGLTSPGQDGGRHNRVRPTKVYKLRDWIMFHVRRGWECVVCLAWRKEAYRGPNISPQILTGCFLRSQSKALHKGMWWDDRKRHKTKQKQGRSELGIRRNIYTTMSDMQWIRLPRETVQSPSLRVSRLHWQSPEHLGLTSELALFWTGVWACSLNYPLVLS